MHCPYCLKDLTQAVRLFGKESLTRHLQQHEVDLIMKIHSAIGSVDWYYKTKTTIIPGVVKLLLEEYNELKRFHETIEENQNEKPN